MIRHLTQLSLYLSISLTLLQFSFQAAIAGTPVDFIGIPLNEFYTRDYSGAKQGAYSDHAPIIYGSTFVWNITRIGTAHPSRGFYFHKFANIVPESSGKPQVETVELYERRLSRITQALERIFSENPVEFGLLQEIPFDEVPEARSLRNKFKMDLFAKGFTLHDDLIDYRQGIVTRNHLKSELLPLKQHQVINQGILARVGNKKEVTISLEKMAVSFFPETKDIYVSVHMGFGLSLPDICDVLQIKGEQLMINFSDSARVHFGGDFNLGRSVHQLASVCVGKNLNISTTPNEGSFSSHSNLLNDPTTMPKSYNIDLMITYTPPT